MWINLIFNAKWKKPNKLTYSMNQLTQIYRTGKRKLRLKHSQQFTQKTITKMKNSFMFRKLKANLTTYGLEKLWWKMFKNQG